MPEASVRSSGASAAMADPILRDPIAFASFKQLGIDPESFAENIVSDADSIREIESSGGKNLTRFWSGNDTTARGDYQITADTLPTMFQRYLNTAFETGQDLPKWIIEAADPQKIETKADKEKFHPQGVGWLVGPDAITDPMDLDPSKQRVLFANGKNRSVRESGDDEKYRRALERGDTEAFADVYMDHWHRGTRFTEAQLNAMEPKKAERLRNEIRAARERADDVYSEFKPRFQSYISEPAESGREPAESIMARETGQEYAIPDLTTYANSGMLSDITDLPSRRGGGEILNEAVVPQRSGRLPEVSAPQRGGRFPEVTPTQRGQIPIPQSRQPEPAPTPQLRPQSEPRLESELAATQMATQNGRFSDAQARSSRVNPTPPELPQLEEVVPTQRGQVPIPSEGSVRPSDVETNVESKLKSSQDAVLDGGVGGVGSITAEPASPEAILSSPEEVSLGVRITTPRGEKQSIDDFPTPTVTTETESVIPQEVIDVERSLQFEKPQRTLPATQIDFDSAFSAATKKQGGPVLSDEVLDKAASNAMPYDPDRQSSAEFLLRNSARNVANYATLNSFDYIESGVRSLMGEDYDDVFLSLIHI